MYILYNFSNYIAKICSQEDNYYNIYIIHTLTNFNDIIFFRHENGLTSQITDHHGRKKHLGMQKLKNCTNSLCIIILIASF